MLKKLRQKQSDVGITLYYCLCSQRQTRPRTQALRLKRLSPKRLTVFDFFSTRNKQFSLLSFNGSATQQKHLLCYFLMMFSYVQDLIFLNWNFLQLFLELNFGNL